jgi:hypothetical protein
MTSHQAAESGREGLLAHALKLEYLTVGWNVVEGVIAVGAALAAGSVALLGFGIDSFVESASGSVLIWRLLAERRARSHEEVARLDRRAHKLVAFSLFALAAWVTFDGIRAPLAVGHWKRIRFRLQPAGGCRSSPWPASA